MAGINLRDELTKAAAKLVNLRIITAIGDPEFKMENDMLKVTGVPSDAAGAVTNINMIDGDIWTLLSPAIATGDLREFRDYHDAMVAKAEGIIQRNIALLQKIVDRLEGRPEVEHQ